MKIKAKCKYDYACMKAATHANIFKRLNPKSVGLILFVLLLADIGIQTVDIFLNGFNAVPVITLVVCLMGLAMLYFVYCELPKRQYMALGELKNLENKYFFEDDRMIILGANNAYKGRMEIEYSTLEKVIETSKYLLLYRSKFESYVVDKSTIVNGNIDDIRAKLVSYLQKQYMHCRY